MVKIFLGQFIAFLSFFLVITLSMPTSNLHFQHLSGTQTQVNNINFTFFILFHHSIWRNRSILRYFEYP